MDGHVSDESFRPLPNAPPTTFGRRLAFCARLMFDLQVFTVYRDLRRHLRGYRGNVLDVGCGLSPYRFLLDEHTTLYVGIDIHDAERFDYANPMIVTFDGEHIPFPDGHFDAVICTEVLEHVANYQQLVDEIHRVMKDGAEAIVTVPWSARFHYVPFDFFRFTPSSLHAIFAGFAESNITPRGTDVSVIASKLVILWFRNAFPRKKRNLAWAPLWVLVSPFILIMMGVAHMCTWAGAGSSDDPLGYTIVATK